MTEAAKVLRQAAELVGRGWTRANYAVDANYKSVPSTNPDAARWCAVGAIWAAAGKHNFGAAEAESMLRRVVHGPLISWNDRPERTQQEVVAALLRAAEIAEAGDA